MPTPAWPDLILLALIVVGYPVWDYYVAWPRARARLESGDPAARRKLYRNALLTQWTATAIVVGMWLAYRRSFVLLGLQMPTGARLVWASVVAVALIALMAAQAISASHATADVRIALRPRLGYAIPILPRTRDERGWFMALSVTAGTCEELIYRGYVVWVLTAWLSLWAAALVSVAAFGVAHAYLGRQGVMRATIAGLVFAAAVVAFRSLYPGMVLHAVLDLGAGAVGYALLNESGAPDRPTTVPSAPA